MLVRRRLQAGTRDGKGEPSRCYEASGDNRIAQSPFEVASRYEKVQGHPVGERAPAVIQALGRNWKTEWAETARLNAAVGTRLSKLGTKVSARLLYQGYVTAMCNLHVIFGDQEGQGGWPLLPVPTLGRFTALVG